MSFGAAWKKEKASVHSLVYQYLIWGKEWGVKSKNKQLTCQCLKKQKIFKENQSKELKPRYGKSLIHTFSAVRCH